MSQSQPLKVPRFLSCLVKGPLGCLSFALGAAVVLVLCLPFACGRLADRTSERWFQERYAGTLEVGDAWLGSFYGPQRIERVILRDPEGDEVLRGELSAPSLSQALEGPLHRFGPVVLRVELMRLVEREDGTSNLERALSPKGPRESWDFSSDVPFEVELRLVIERLRYSSVSGGEEALDDLVLRGTLEWGPDATHLVLEGGSREDAAEPFAARVDLQHAEFASRHTWASSLALEGAPTSLARTACVAFRPLAAFAGARLDHLKWTQQGSDVLLSCEDGGARFELHGEEQDGLVLASAGGSLSASIPCSSRPGNQLLASLLPLVESIECLEPTSRTHELRLAEFRWPLGGDWRALEGELELSLVPSRVRLAPLFDGQDEFDLSLESAARFSVRAGRLEYSAFTLPVGNGRIQVDGHLELAGGVSDLALSGELDDEPLSMRLRGRGDALVPAAPVPPAVQPPAPAR